MKKTRFTDEQMVTILREADQLGGRAPDVLGPRTFRRILAEVEFDAVTLSQILEALVRHGAPMEEIILPRLVPDEPKSLIFMERPNRSRHR